MRQPNIVQARSRRRFGQAEVETDDLLDIVGVVAYHNNFSGSVGMRFLLDVGLLARQRLHLALSNSIAFSLNQADLGMMSESVQQRRNAGRVGKDQIPVFEGAVGRDQNRAALVSTIDDFVKQVGGVLIFGSL